MWAPWVAERTMDLASSSALSWPPGSLGEPTNLLGPLFPHLGHRTEPVLPTSQGWWITKRKVQVKRSQKVASATWMLTVVKRGGLVQGEQQASPNKAGFKSWLFHSYFLAYLLKRPLLKSDFKWLQHYGSCVVLDNLTTLPEPRFASLWNGEEQMIVSHAVVDGTWDSTASG